MNKAGICIICLLVSYASLFISDVSAGPASRRILFPSDVKTTSKEVCGLLEARQYEKLDALLQRLHESYLSDYKKEEDNERAYDCFFMRSNTSFEKLLNDWIAARPNSAYAYLARAGYYQNMGWKARGAQWASETKDEEFRNMELFFSKSEADIKRVININPRIIDAYTLMLGMAAPRSSGNAKDHLDKALKINPYAFWPRMIFMSTLHPRWGGSLGEMSRFIETTRPYLEKNPKLKALAGRLSTEFGDQASWEDNWAKALEYYSEAVKAGEVNLYLFKRGKALYKLKRFKEAILDFSTILATNPYHFDALTYRAVSFYELGGYGRALTDINIAIEIDPKDAFAHWIRGISHGAACDFKPAIDSLEKAKEIDSSVPAYDKYIKIFGSRMHAKDDCQRLGKTFNCRKSECETKSGSGGAPKR